MPIANFFITRILKAYRDLNHYDEDDIDMIRYGLQASLWEIEKLLYMVIIFIALGHGWQFAISAIALISVRVMAGGYHASTAWRCFWWTFFGFVLALLVLPMMGVNNIMIVALGVFCLGATFVAAPLRSKQMDSIANKDKDKQKKLVALIITAIWFIVLFTYQEHLPVAPIMWAISLQNLQLIITWAVRKAKK